MKGDHNQLEKARDISCYFRHNQISCVAGGCACLKALSGKAPFFCSRHFLNTHHQRNCHPCRLKQKKKKLPREARHSVVCNNSDSYGAYFVIAGLTYEENVCLSMPSGVSQSMHFPQPFPPQHKKLLGIG